MTREEAAVLLGVPLDAQANTVRHAWRMWVRIAHPDVGGDPTHFAQLDEARRILIRPLPAPEFVVEPTPRLAWSQVLRRPAHSVALAIAGIATILLAIIPASLPVSFAACVGVASIAATAWAVWFMREVLNPNADHGHRIAVLALSWLPIALIQVLVSVVIGFSLIPVLPLLALPFVAAVASVNPGAGLWRPVGR